MMSRILFSLMALGCLVSPAVAEQLVAEKSVDPQAMVMIEMSPIERVQKAGLMAGFPDGMFHAEKPVTRAELAKILVDAFNVRNRRTPELKQVNVEDVPEDFWAHEAIHTALSHGLMEGYRTGRFHPNHPVSRAEGFAIFAQAYGVYQFTPDTVNDILGEYSDAKEIPGWAKQAMATALRFGFVNTNDHQIRPEAAMSRGDLAYALSKYLNRKMGYDLNEPEQHIERAE